MKGKQTTTERYKQLIEALEKTPLPEGITAAYHMDRATKQEVETFAREHDKVAYQRPNGNLYVNFKYTPAIDIYIWE